MRMRLGEFDPAEMVPYEKIAGTEEPWYGEKNKALARKVTQESIVLLKNSDNLLPLDRSKLRSIAVIGPFADRVFIDSYAGIPPYSVTPLEGIRNKVGPKVRVRFVPNDTHSNAVNLAANPTWPLYLWAIIPRATRRTSRARCCPMRQGGVGPQGIDLDPAQLSLIRSVKEANAKTIVVLISSFPYAIVGARERPGNSSHVAYQPGGRQRHRGCAVWRL